MHGCAWLCTIHCLHDTLHVHLSLQVGGVVLLAVGALHVLTALCVCVAAVHIHCGLRWNSALLATQTMSEPRELVQPQRSRVVAHTVGM